MYKFIDSQLCISYGKGFGRFVVIRSTSAGVYYCSSDWTGDFVCERLERCPKFMNIALMLSYWLLLPFFLCCRIADWYITLAFSLYFKSGLN